jgi:hypothetical protein
MLVSEDKVLSIIQNGPATGMSNIEISKKILEENPHQDNLRSVKVMVSRKIGELVIKGYLAQVGRRYNITEKGLPKKSRGTILKTSYSTKSIYLPKLQASISVPSTARGQAIIDDPRIINALEMINNALQADDKITIIVKKDK